MNPNPDRKLTTLLFNPFVYIAGAKALFPGLGAILVAGLIVPRAIPILTAC